jgi:hypothetical protein
LGVTSPQPKKEKRKKEECIKRNTNSKVLGTLLGVVLDLGIGTGKCKKY